MPLPALPASWSAALATLGQRLRPLLRRALLLLLTALFALLFALLAQAHHGTVLLFWQPWRLAVSLNFALLLLALALAAAAALGYRLGRKTRKAAAKPPAP